MIPTAVGLCAGAALLLLGIGLTAWAAIHPYEENQ